MSLFMKHSRVMAVPARTAEGTVGRTFLKVFITPSRDDTDGDSLRNVAHWSQIGPAYLPWLHCINVIIGNYVK
jgi:hypothetical protein